MSLLKIADLQYFIHDVDMDSDPRVYVVTGADSGLGEAVAGLLNARGRVITCGVGDDMQVRADLTTPDGRLRLLSEIQTRSAGRVDGVVAAAGIGAPRAETVALNYFGTVALLEGLVPLLARSSAPAAAVVSSSSTLNRGSGALVRACLGGEEPDALKAAQRLIRRRRGTQIYRSSKIALNRWVRSAAIRPEWAGQGIVLNAVAPGIIATDTVMRTWERDRRLLETALPQPLGAPGPVASVAALLAHTVAPENRFMTGQVIYCDGGTDAVVRGARPQEVFLRYRPREILTMVRESRRMSR